MIYGIILAAGTGKRMKSSIQKQYMDLCGKPVLYYALAAFENSDVDKIIVVTGKDEVEYVNKNIIQKYKISKVQKIVEGGKERYNSVYNALCSIDNASTVLIHDGARPFISSDKINELIQNAAEYPAIIAGVPVKDTIKSTNTEGLVMETIPRENLWQVQTPQVFDYIKLKKAYEDILGSEHEEGITDDSMIWEKIYKNYPVKMIFGDYNNIKLTTPEDLVVGESIINASKSTKYSCV